jgi:hypothetical protein
MGRRVAAQLVRSPKSPSIPVLMHAGALVTFRMVDLSPPTESDEDEAQGQRRAEGGSGREGAEVRVQSPPPRGLCMGLTWMQKGGQALQVERYYDGEGILRDVRMATAVKGGWSGGRM